MPRLCFNEKGVGCDRFDGWKGIIIKMQLDTRSKKISMQMYKRCRAYSPFIWARMVRVLFRVCPRQRSALINFECFQVYRYHALRRVSSISSMEKMARDCYSLWEGIKRFNYDTIFIKVLQN